MFPTTAASRLCATRRLIAPRCLCRRAIFPQAAARAIRSTGTGISRRARGFPVYAALRQLGREGLSALVARTCHQARALAEEIGGLAGAELIAVPDLTRRWFVFCRNRPARRTPTTTGERMKSLQPSTHRAKHVWRRHLARQARDAHQRQQLAHDGNRHRADRRRSPEGPRRLASAILLLAIPV